MGDSDVSELAGCAKSVSASHMNNISIIDYDSVHKSDLMKVMGSKPFKKKLWDWQFHEARNSDDIKPLVVLNDKNEVVGFNGVMPIKVKYYNKTIDSIWSCDFFLSKECRGKGFGKQVKSVLREKSDLIMSFGISAMASPVLLRMGWKENGEVRAYARINKVGTFKQRIKRLLQAYNSVVNYKFNSHIVPQFELSKRLPQEEDVNSLWRKCSLNYKKIIVRDFNYLNWKYQRHPLCDYQFLNVKVDGQLAAIAILREGDDYIQIVDYIGPLNAQALKSAIIRYICNKYHNYNVLKCVTSDAELQKALKVNKFIKERTKPKFYIYSNLSDDDAIGDWFIMGGDSDADLLNAAADSNRLESDKRLNILVRDEAYFNGMANEWTELLNNSVSNPLFMSWGWMNTWWNVWGGGDHFKLYLLLVYDEQDHLIGIAPFYITTTKSKLKRLQFLGQQRKSKDNIRSEYLGIISRQERAAAVEKCVANFLLSDRSWDEILLCDIKDLSIFISYLGRAEKKLYIRQLARDIGVRLSVRGAYDDYVQSLGKNTRYKVSNRRNYLDKKYDVKLIEPENDKFSEFIDALNELHFVRWGVPCFYTKASEFHKKLSKIDSSLVIKPSLISIDGEVQSMLYDIECGSVRYNIQSGFNDKFDKKVSLGTVHFAYAIESSFLQDQINSYDFLAGPGKTSHYKEHFNGNDVCFYTVQIVRGRFYKILYGLYDHLPDRVKRFVRPVLSGV